MIFQNWNFKDVDASKHFFICMVSNSAMFQSRYVLYKRFAAQFPEGKLLTCEVAFGDRPFEITEENNPMHVQLRTSSELWLKENAWNLTVQYLTQKVPSWKYVTFIDADVLFTAPNFEQKIVHTLQHYPVVQPWASCVDLGPDDEPISVSRSFMNNWINNTWERIPKEPAYYYGKTGAFIGHPGMGISMRREAYDALGGLFDLAILGSGDHHFWMAMIGMVVGTRPDGAHPNYKKVLSDYQSRALKGIDKSLGYVQIGLNHLWHGPKRNRYYVSRWKILTENQFDPLVDIRRDAGGLYRLDGTDKLKREIQLYFRARLEDSKEF